MEMKHKGAEKVQARLAGMSREEELQYWEERGRVLRARQQEVIAEEGIVIFCADNQAHREASSE